MIDITKVITSLTSLWQAIAQRKDRQQHLDSLELLREMRQVLQTVRHPRFAGCCCDGKHCGELDCRIRYRLTYVGKAGDLLSKAELKIPLSDVVSTREVKRLAGLIKKLAHEEECALNRVPRGEDTRAIRYATDIDPFADEVDDCIRELEKRLA